MTHLGSSKIVSASSQTSHSSITEHNICHCQGIPLSSRGATEGEIHDSSAVLYK